MEDTMRDTEIRAPVRVLVWGENWWEQNRPEVLERYQDGIHGAVRAGIGDWLGEKAVVTTTVFDEPEHGLTEEASAGPTCLSGGAMSSTTRSTTLWSHACMRLCFRVWGSSCSTPGTSRRSSAG